MKPYQHFKKIFSSKNLKELYRQKVEFRAVPGIDKINRKVFEKRFDSEINIIHKKIHNETYNFSFYKEQLISKGRGKYPRVLSLPTIRDKITLKSISEFLSLIFDDAVARELVHTKISNIKDDILSGNYDSFVKIDMKDFFPSINHNLLKKMIYKRIRKKAFISLLIKAIKQSTINKPVKGTEKYSSSKGVPQGLSISNILADIFMQDIDIKYKR